MKMHFVVIGLVVLCIGLAAADCSDDDVRRLVIRSGSYIDNPELAREDFRLARDLCEADTNRFARILYELAQTGDMRVKDRMISRLGRYGTAAELPFLYSMATNARHGATAVKAILRLEGVTSNSVCCVNRYLADSQSGDRNCYYVCETLLVQAKNIPLASEVRSNALSVARQFMASRNIYHDWLDHSMKCADATYSVSKRRLAVLRSVAARTQDPWDLLYVTNAINELVAYPEAELPE